MTALVLALLVGQSPAREAVDAFAAKMIPSPRLSELNAAPESQFVRRGWTQQEATRVVEARAHGEPWRTLLSVGAGLLVASAVEVPVFLDRPASLIAGGIGTGVLAALFATATLLARPSFEPLLTTWMARDARLRSLARADAHDHPVVERLTERTLSLGLHDDTIAYARNGEAVDAESEAALFAAVPAATERRSSARTKVAISFSLLALGMGIVAAAPVTIGAIDWKVAESSFLGGGMAVVGGAVILVAGLVARSGEDDEFASLDAYNTMLVETARRELEAEQSATIPPP